MRPWELKDNIGKFARLNGDRDLGMDSELRKVIGKVVKIMKHCKSGMVQIKSNNQLLSVAMYNLNVIDQSSVVVPEDPNNEDVRLLVNVNQLIVGRRYWFKYKRDYRTPTEMVVQKQDGIKYIVTEDMSGCAADSMFEKIDIIGPIPEMSLNEFENIKQKGKA